MVRSHGNVIRPAGAGTIPFAMSISPAPVVDIPPCSGTAFPVGAGSSLHVIDPKGEQVADLVAFAADDLGEALSNGRTFDYSSTIRLSTGHVLYSNRSSPLLTIVYDDVGVHDFLLSPCSRDTWRIGYGDENDDRPGCYGNLVMALEPFGIEPGAIPTPLNLFMNVAIEPNGHFTVRPPRSKAGDRVILRAERDLIVGLTACSAARSNNGQYKPIRYTVTSEHHRA
jgi:uncharacterized protein YcgI (DUF1989 family)